MAIKVKVRPSLTKEQLYTELELKEQLITELELKEQLITNLEDEIAEMDAEIAALRHENGNLRALVRTKTADNWEKDKQLEMMALTQQLQRFTREGNKTAVGTILDQIIAIAKESGKYDI